MHYAYNQLKGLWWLIPCDTLNPQKLKITARLILGVRCVTHTIKGFRAKRYVAYILQRSAFEAL